MLFSICWMVTRDPQADGERMISVLLGWFLAGGLVGGALMGAVVAIPAWALSRAFGAHISAFVVATAVVAVVYLGKAANLWPAPKPQFRHQVPEAWRNLFIPSIAAFIYSAGLGALFFTRLASLAVYPFAIMLIGIGGNPIGVIALLAATGLVRGA